jgi:NAD(P)-dependent dehydrogenase (short-subunit alcohol dehydrogenase family)
MKANGKVFVVTGAGNGIGRQLALELLRRGARVAAVDLSVPGLAETSRLAASVALATFVVDVSKRDQVEALPSAVAERFGPADALINCAGIVQPFVPIAQLDYATIERVFGVNWLGTLYMTKTFLPGLVARPEAHLVNVSSMGGFTPFPGQTAYGASKAAVKLLTEGLQGELAGTSVRVTAVYPGAIGTDILKNSGVQGPRVEDAKGRVLSPERAARLIVDAVERDRARVMVGNDARALDWLTRLAPVRSASFIARQLKRLTEGAAKEK